MTPSDQPNQQRPPIFEFFDVLKRRGLWILLVTLIVAAGVYVLEASKPVKFQATSLINYEPSQQNLESLLGVSESNSDQNVNGVTNPQLLTAASLAVSPSVASRASQALGGTPTAATILNDVTVTADNSGATILQVAATDVSATTALRVSRAYANAYVADQTNAEQSTVTTAITKVAAQIAATKSTDPQGTAVLASLYERQSQLQQINLLSQPPVTLGLLASTAMRDAPSKVRTALLAGVIALILTLSIAVVFERALAEGRRPAVEIEPETVAAETMMTAEVSAPGHAVPAPSAHAPAPVRLEGFDRPQTTLPVAAAETTRPSVAAAADPAGGESAERASTFELWSLLSLRAWRWILARVLPLLRVDGRTASAGNSPGVGIKTPSA